MIFFGSVILSTTSLAQEVNVPATIKKSSYIFVMDINGDGIAKVTETVRSKNEKTAKEYINKLEDGKWPTKNTVTLICLHEIRGDDGKILMLSNTFKLEQRRYIHVDLFKWIDYKMLLKE